MINYDIDTIYDSSNVPKNSIEERVSKLESGSESSNTGSSSYVDLFLPEDASLSGKSVNVSDNTFTNCTRDDFIQYLAENKVIRLAIPSNDTFVSYYLFTQFQLELPSYVTASALMDGTLITFSAQLDD